MLQVRGTENSADGIAGSGESGSRFSVLGERRDERGGIQGHTQFRGRVNVSYVQNEDSIESGYCQDSTSGFALKLTYSHLCSGEDLMPLKLRRQL